MTTNIEFDAVSNSWDEHSSAAENHNSTGVQVAQATTGQAASEPVPVDVGSGAPTQGAANAPAANQPAADANAPASNAPASNAVQGNAPAANAPATNAAAANVPHEYHAEAGNVVKLPANVSIDNIKVDGHNLVLVQPDGSEIVIKDGALNVPTFILGDVEVPRVALIAALETSHVDVAFGADGSISAGGNGAPGSAGGNFSVPPGGIGDGFGLTALLPPTALQFGQPEHRELFPGLVDRGISVVAVSLLSPTEAASETGLNGGPQQSPGSDAPSDAETSSNGTITIDAPDGIGSIVINGVAVTAVGQQIQGQFGYITIVSLNTSTGVVEYNYTVTESVTHPVNTDGYDQNDTIPDNFSITVTDSDGDTASTTFAVAIIDDVPTAVADTDSVAAGQLGPATGNVLLGGTDAGDSNTTDGVKDVQGADGAKVVGVAKGTTNADLDDASTLDVQVQGAYGKLTLHADGTYTYVRDANTPGGVNDVFTYTIKDGDGDTSHTTLTISIGNSTPEISDLTPEANGGDVVVNEDDLLAGRGPGESAGSDPSKESTTQGGTFTIHSPDGIASLNIGGHDFITNGQFTGGSFTTALGNTLEVTAYNAATGEVTYTYTLVDNEEHSAIQGTNSLFENFDVTLTDLDGQSANSTLSVNIVDDVPTAHADSNSVSEGSQVSGNVLTDGTADVLGADGAAPGGAVTGVATGSNVSNPVSGNLGGAGIVGQYGTLILNANGSYTYTANPNAVTANAVDHFVYTITDGDGDTSTVTLDITVNNVTVTASDTDALVYEKGLPAGSDAAGNSEIFNGAITPAGGTGPYTYTLNSSATGSYGNLVLNADGTYTYTLTKTYDGATANNGITTEQDKDSFTYTVTDAHGNTTTGTILVDIVDDVPTAHADTNSVSEGSQVSGNVLTDGTADVLGADGAAPGGAVTGVATGSNVSNPVSGNLGGAGILGQYGTLVLNANGSYTYTANPNAVTANAVDHFVYTITDGDGDTSTVTLDITVNNVTVTASDTDALVYEKGLPAGSDAAGNSEIFNGAITPAGGTGPYTYTLNSSATGSYGNLVLNADGTYTYTLTKTYDGATANNGITTEQDKDSFTYTVTDAHGNTTTGTILVDIVDDVPTAHADTNSVSEGSQVSGNVLTDGTADVLGADGAAPGGAVTGVATGSNVSNPVSGNLGGAGIVGQYGTLVLNANGSYTYTANPNAVTANAVDHFVYTITDGDGDTSTVTLDITVNNVTVTASDTDALVYEKGLPAGSDAAGNSEIFNGAITPAGGTGPYTYTLNSSATGSYGNLVLNADGTYTYTLTKTYDGATANNGITTEQDKDSFTYTVTDAHGNTTTGTILVDIVDDVPTAHADTNSVSEGSQVSGNVLTDGTADVLGADGAAPGGAVTGVATGSNVSNPVSGNLGGAGIVGQYGTLVLNANGSYTYTANPNAVTANAVDHFVYTITDGDGDTSTVTLDITVNNVTVTASDTDALVYEKGLPAGSDAAGNSEIFNGAITPAGGTGPYTYTLNSSATGSYGNLVLNADGTYTYTLTKTYDGATANNGITTEQDKDSFTYTVTDAHGNTTTGTILVDIVDDVPTAHADTNSVSEGSQVSGNVLTDGTADVLGADGAAPGGAVTGVATGSNVSNPVSGNLGGAGILGQYGTLVLNANGSYTYTANPNAVTANAVDHFVYTITDGDGDTSTVTLDITVNNVTVTASDTDALVYEKGLPAGSDAAGNSEIFNGAITPAGGTGPYTYTLNSSATGSYGNLVLNADGTYTYTLTKTYDGATANNGITTEQDKDSFTYTVTDAHGNTTTGTILVDIVDDVPTAHADTNSVSEGSQVSGNVLTDGTADVLGADGAAPGGAVTGVATGSNVSNPVSGNLGGAGIVGQYGTLVLNANGSYTYTANPNAVTANAVDHFVYTITDGDGDTSTVTLDITVNNVTVTASDTDALVYEKGLPAGSDAAGNSEIFNGAITPAGGTGPYTYTLNSSATGSYGNLVLNADGTYTYTLTKTYDGATANNGITTEQDKDSFTYTVTDAHGNTTTGTILVDIVDDVPAYTLVNDGNHDGIVSLSVLNPAATTTYTGQFAEWQYGADGFGSISATGQNVQVASSSSSQIVLNLMDGSDVAAVLTLNADGTDSLQVLHRAGDVVFTPIAATSATAGGPTGSLIVDLGAATDFNILVTGDDGVAPTGQSGDLVNTSNQGWAVKGSSGQTNDPGESIKFAFVNDSNNTTPHSVDDFKFTTEGYTGGMSTAKITVLVYTDATHYDQVTLNVTSGQVIQISQLNWSAVAGTANYVVGDDIYAVKVLSDASNSGGFRLNGVEVGSQSEAPPSDLDFNGINVSITDGDGDVSTQTFNVHIDGTAGSQLTVESIAGTSGDDNLLGTGGNDTLVGGAGNDFLDGAAGNDILIGGLGFNHLTGGSGNDTFVIDPSKLSVHVADVIADYTPGQDVIDLSDLLKSLGAGAPTTDAQAGSSIDVTFSGGAAHVMVDNNGTAAGGSMVEVASLTGVASGSVISILYDHNQPTHTETVT